MMHSADPILRSSIAPALPAPGARFGRAGQWAAGWKTRRALRQKLPRAFAAFVRRHPTWVASLFDRHFLAHHAEPWLRANWGAAGRLDPAEMAGAWADQFHWSDARLRRKFVAAILPAVSDFLDMLAREMQPNS